MDIVERLKMKGQNLPTPPLKFMYISVKTLRNKAKRMNEICLITTHCVEQEIVNQSEDGGNNRRSGRKSGSGFKKKRDLPGLKLSFLKKPNDSSFPFDL